MTSRCLSDYTEMIEQDCAISPQYLLSIANVFSALCTRSWNRYSNRTCATHCTWCAYSMPSWFFELQKGWFFWVAEMRVNQSCAGISQSVRKELILLNVHQVFDCRRSGCKSHLRVIDLNCIYSQKRGVRCWNRKPCVILKCFVCALMTYKTFKK